MTGMATPAPPEGETVLECFRPDRTAYVRAHGWMAALATGLGMGALWAIGNPHVWTGAVGGLAAVALRGVWLASEELAARWDLTDRHLLGPGGRRVPLAGIAQVNVLGSAVQVVTRAGDKHLIRYQADAGATRAAIEAARSAA